MTALPTPTEMFNAAEGHMDWASSLLSDARNVLQSALRPGHEMTDEQARRRTRMFAAIGEAKKAIEEGLG